jgi:uncharacterized membrane protein YhaH (DUF805 family)
MRRTGRKKEWSVVLFCGAILILLPPLISLYDKADFFMSLPQAYVVMYGLWAFVIAAIALGARRRSRQNQAAEVKPAAIRDQGDG